MLEKFKHFQNLWTPYFFIELFRLFTDGTWWKHEDLIAHFRNRKIGSYTLFDGGIAFAMELGYLIRREGKYFKSGLIVEEDFQTENSVRNFFLKTIGDNIALKNDVIDIFGPTHVSYNENESLFDISNDAFGFGYSNFKHLLLDFELINPSKTHNFKYLIDPSFKESLVNFRIFEESRRKMSIEELKKRIENDEKNGLIAENYVLDYESNRLNWLKNPLRISDVDVCAGFDILSFDNAWCIRHDRFIEVKSFCNAPSFYWSRNEIEIARSLRSKYFLYLVDRNQINKQNYVPEIIANPYESVLGGSSEWITTPDWFFVSKT